MKNQSYMAKKVQMDEKMKAVGLVSKCFPDVLDIVIHMTYDRKTSSSFSLERTLNFSQSSYAYFDINCIIKDCVYGNLNLTPLISSMVKEHKKNGTGREVFKVSKDSYISGDVGISYKINIKYNNKVKHSSH
ncbi:MAG: hypothetical protein Q7U10_07310 [Thermodesulfovibrionia bacterium]|nr:hypothetical protein [Thermodesulfovibrionia bacterium]